ncbi:hypothetical protein GCM10010231_55920 [Streptomyces sindenensis]|nr:hypothetical protein GCM10010231_55920 [Streptomyces sindenensis]
MLPLFLIIIINETGEGTHVDGRSRCPVPRGTGSGHRRVCSGRREDHHGSRTAPGGGGEPDKLQGDRQSTEKEENSGGDEGDRTDRGERHTRSPPGPHTKRLLATELATTSTSVTPTEAKLVLNLGQQLLDRTVHVRRGREILVAVAMIGRGGHGHSLTEYLPPPESAGRGAGCFHLGAKQKTNRAPTVSGDPAYFVDARF